MIQIDLSVPPHHNTTPPHTILKKQFGTWEEARKWVRSMDFKTGGLEWFYNNPSNEYVQVGVELKEITGRNYTTAVLSIEGNEDRFDPDDPRDQIKYIKDWAEARIKDPLNDPSTKETHEMVILACNIIDQYLKAEPLDDGESRMTHIYG